MNSTLKLYKNCKIIPSKNFKVDEIENYLSTLTTTTISNFQYIKHALNLTIKVDLSQTDLTFSNDFNINYVSIKNGENGTLVYYFVKNKQWKGESTIEFDLFCDTINSFNDILSISPKTKILRQHLDRFIKYESITYGNIISGIMPYNPSFNFTNVSITYDFSDMKVGNISLINLNNSPITKLLKSRNGTAYRIYLSISFDGSFGRAIKFYSIKKDYSEMQLLGSDSSATTSPISYTLTKTTNWSINIGGVDLSIPENYYLGIFNDGVLVVKKITIWFEYQSGGTWGGFSNLNEFNWQHFFTGMGIIDFDAEIGKCKPVIDMHTEGIAPMLYGNDLDLLNDDINTDWFLIYANQNNPSDSLVNPVDCFIVPKERVIFTDFDTLISGNWGNNLFRDNLTPTEIVDEPQGDIYYIHGKYAEADASLTGSFTYNGNIINQINITPTSYLIMYLYRQYIDAQYVYYLIIKRYDYETNTLIATYYYDCTDISAYMGYSNITIVQKGAYTLNVNTSERYGTATELVGSRNLIDFITIKEIDRTNPKIIKCIELPYFPSLIVKNTNVIGYRIPTETWQNSSLTDFGRVLKLKSTNETLDRNMIFNLESDRNPFNVLKIKKFSVYTKKSILNEPKLYHSDYYQPKFVYDSFGFAFQLELLSDGIYKLTDENAVNINFHTTTTINSRFMFTFNDYVCESKELQDYNNIMCIARNNEMPLYNQQYINYLRVGYNYEVKNKQRTEAFSWLGAGLSVAGAVASFASSVYTGGFGIAMGVSFTTSALGTIANAINTTITNEQNFKQKQDQLKNQTTSVYGSDDVDLMNAYAKNRLKLKLYEVSPRMKQLLFDLFFYTGYISNTLGVPNTTSRSRFNFVSAEIIFNQVPNLPEEMTEDIKNRYSIGLTFLHKFDNSWDFDQIYENWETNLLN